VFYVGAFQAHHVVELNKISKLYRYILYTMHIIFMYAYRENLEISGVKSNDCPQYFIYTSIVFPNFPRYTANTYLFHSDEFKITTLFGSSEQVLEPAQYLGIYIILLSYCII